MSILFFFHGKSKEKWDGRTNKDKDHTMLKRKHSTYGEIVFRM